MYAYLKGIITYKSPTKIFVECAGVGYEVHITLQTFAQIEELKETKIYTYVHITDQAQTMYGFAEELEKEVFLMLISVNGIGPSTARLVLSSLSPQELKNAIIHSDVSLIKQTKGIGPKTAQRMILELKDKIIKLELEEGVTPSALTSSSPSAMIEAISALTMLGFTKGQSEKVVKKLAQNHPEITTAEELIKLSLKNL